MAKRGPHESIRATRAHRDSACAPKKPRSVRCQGRAQPPHHRSRSSCSSVDQPAAAALRASVLQHNSVNRCFLDNRRRWPSKERRCDPARSVTQTQPKRSSSAVATSRAGRRSPGSDRASQHRRGAVTHLKARRTVENALCPVADKPKLLDFRPIEAHGFKHNSSAGGPEATGIGGRHDLRPPRARIRHT